MFIILTLGNLDYAICSFLALFQVVNQASYGATLLRDEMLSLIRVSWCWHVVHRRFFFQNVLPHAEMFSFLQIFFSAFFFLLTYGKGFSLGVEALDSSSDIIARIFIIIFIIIILYLLWRLYLLGIIFINKYNGDYIY